MQQSACLLSQDIHTLMKVLPRTHAHTWPTWIQALLGGFESEQLETPYTGAGGPGERKQVPGAAGI